MKFSAVLVSVVLVGVLASGAMASKRVKAQVTYVPVGKSQVELSTTRGKTTLRPLRGAPVTFKGRVLGMTGDGHLLVKLGGVGEPGHLAINPRTGDTSKMPAGSDSAIQKLVRRPIR